MAPVSLLLEDATVVAVVKFCRGGSASALPLAEWLRFIWVMCSGVTVLDAGGVCRGVARLGAGCRDVGGKNLEFSKPLGFRKTHLQMLARLLVKQGTMKKKYKWGRTLRGLTVSAFPPVFGVGVPPRRLRRARR